MTYGISIYVKSERKRVPLKNAGKIDSYKTKAEAKKDIKKYYTSDIVKTQYKNPRVFKIK